MAKVGIGECLLASFASLAVGAAAFILLMLAHGAEVKLPDPRIVAAEQARAIYSRMVDHHKP